MKKLISLALALIMVFSLTTVALAEDQDNPDAVTPTEEYKDATTVTIKKSYELNGSAGAVSPAETFSFTVDKGWTEDSSTVYVENPATGVTKDNMPVPSTSQIGSITYAAGDAGNTETMVKALTITLPTYTGVGIYHYTVRENASTTAGVSYYSSPIHLVVTVIQQGTDKVRVAAVHTETQGTKSDTFSNTYSAGTLSVSKTVAGKLGDQTKEFAFTVTFNAPSGTKFNDVQLANNGTAGGINFEKSSTSTDTSVTYTFNLKHGQTATFTNVPADTTYTVSEATYSDYVTTSEVSSSIQNSTNGTIEAGETETVAYTNTKDATIDTGIALDTLPFVLILAVCAGAVVLFVIKRRRSVDF